AAVTMAPVAYITVTAQTLRGHNPRFSDHPDALDWVFAQVFSLTAIAVIATFVITVVWIWRRRDNWRDGPIRLSVVYAGFATVFGGFGVGVAMFFHRSRYIGGGGNLLPLHALAFHSLQAVPVVAVILHRAGLRGQASHRLVHVAGISWLGLT